MSEHSRDTVSYISSNERKRNKTRSRSRNRKGENKRSKYSPHQKRSHRSNFPKKKQDKKIHEKRSSSHWCRRSTPHFDWKINSYIRSYKVKDHIADGTFGRCLLVKHKYTGKYYAAKVIKPVEKYLNSAKEETDLCHLINKKDKDHWCAKIIETFDHKGHYIMIFEQLGKSIYRLLKKNKHEGLPLP